MCSNGCEWTGSYKDFVENDHLSTCGFVITKCPNKDCEETFLKKILEQHRSECPWEKVKCMYCEDDITRKDKQSHEEEQCIKFPVECTKCLRKEIPRELLRIHIYNECVKTKVRCPYLLSGCDFIVERDMMEAHVEEQVNKHLLLVQENYDQRITQAYEEIIKLHEEKDKQQKQIVQLTWNLTSFQGYKNSFAHFWEIPEITDKLKTEHNLFSDQFYTEPGDSGYRFHLRFDSRSKDVGTQSNPFIGLYFGLSSGDHDDALTWPFKQEYTLTIVNQAGKPDKQHTFKPEEHDTKDCFLKLDEARCTLHFGLGTAGFISHQELTSGGFIRNDKLLITCQVKLT